MSKHVFHLKSMTAYGRGTYAFPFGVFTIEIQSVNRRYLDMNITLPRLLTRFEMCVRKKITERIGRGMLSVFIGWRPDAKNPVTVVPDLALARGIRNAWAQIAFDLGVEEPVGLALLAREKDLLIYEDKLSEEHTFQKALEAGLDEALDHLLAMKEKEGKLLSQDLYERVGSLEKRMDEIEKQAPSIREKYRVKLTERMKELFSENVESEERILREIALYAERCDITEEITRFKSHVQQLCQMLVSPLTQVNEARGKTVDFLIQELNREINTIGAKASDLTITQYVVAIKGELEKMREQVQNIE